ncbi:torsin-1A-like [Palaemon carinicauda]|uniref:torsin-1A-like n=1 Tax=Palaemon carinicauda TaxID=392227 RepID=UPI0035B60D20
MRPHLIFKAIICFSIFIVANASISLGVASIGIVGSALYAGFDRVRCSFYECCSANSKWTKPNMTALTLAFDEHLYGQHLVKTVIPRALKSHLSHDQPSKALVMSFHGWTGGGKNYVARFIIDSLYKLGQRSQYVHFFVSTVHFPHIQEADIYKLHLQDWIRGNVSKCERSLFIFDEIDKMPVGMIDGIKPFIDYHESIDGVDFRKSIFIFLSNTGGPEITRFMLQVWRSGKNREDITMSDMEHLVERGAFNEQGGLHKSELIQHSLVDYYVPFLPLERRHVEFCIRDEVQRRGHKGSKEFIKAVADEMVYFPPENQLFSTTGCKRVSQKVSYHLTNEMYDVLFE